MEILQWIQPVKFPDSTDSIAGPTLNLHWVDAPCLPQQTRDIDPMLDQCCATVYDAGPTLVQHWVDVSCSLGLDINWGP